MQGISLEVIVEGVGKSTVHLSANLRICASLHWNACKTNCVPLSKIRLNIYL